MHNRLLSQRGTYNAGVKSSIDPADRILTWVKQAEQATQAAKDAALAGFGLPKAQYNALLMLSVDEGITAAELARRCFITPQSAGETVKRLEAKGLITRVPHPVHVHVTETKVTPEGYAVLEKADAAVTAVEQRLRDTLTAPELESLRELLERIRHTA